MYQKSKYDIMRQSLHLQSVYHTHDYRTLYELLEERKPTQNISHKKMPSFEGHMEFVHSHPYLAWYYIICEYEGHPHKVGSIYLTHNNEIGLFVFKRYTKHGFASLALMNLMENWPGAKKLLANVNPKNGPSIEFFKKHGFKPLQAIYVLERD